MTENLPMQQGPDSAVLLRALGPRSVVFVGLMGAGKTAIGRRVARMLHLPFVDCDQEIEAASRMSIPELFENYGEGEFRSLERRVVRRLLKSGPRVIATGGGAFMSDQTRKNVAKYGVAVWLKADIEVLLERVKRRDNRPLLQNSDPRLTLERLIEERYPYYRKADITVNSRDVMKESIAMEVVDALSSYLVPSPDCEPEKSSI